MTGNSQFVKLFFSFIHSVKRRIVKIFVSLETATAFSLLLRSLMLPKDPMTEISQRQNQKYSDKPNDFTTDC